MKKNIKENTKSERQRGKRISLCVESELAETDPDQAFTSFTFAMRQSLPE